MNWTKLDVINHERKRGKAEPVKLSKAVEREAELHNQIIAWCDSRWPRWKYIHSRMDKKATTAPGTPDFVIFAPHGQTYCFECKAKGGKRSQEQTIWAHEMASLGHPTFLIFSLEEFINLVTPLQT